MYLLFYAFMLYYSCFEQSSVSTPNVDFGCKNPIFKPSAPFLDCLSIKVTPLSSANFKASVALSTANARW